MSDHKTGNSTFDKEPYWKRRKEGKRGQEDTVTTVKADSRISRGKTSGGRAQRRLQWMAFRRQERRGSARSA